MKRLVAALIASIALVDVHAQNEPARGANAPAVVNNPDESSPFFLSAKQDVLPNKIADVSAGYPRVKRNTERNAEPPLAQAGKFFTGMFSSVRFDSVSEKQPASSLTVEPTAPELNEVRDVDVTYTVRNNSTKLTRLVFPTSQRTEFLTQKSSGEIIDKWSDDRAFEPEEEIVVVNPKERLEYQVKIPTRDMKAGESYNVEASLKTTPDFSVKQSVNPR